MSLFNPWVLLGILMAVIGAGTTGYIKGGSDESKRQQLEIARLNEQARVKEQALVTAVQKQATELVKANNNAKTVIQKRNADIDSGTLRLRIPVKTTACPIQTTADPTPAPRDSIQTGAELERETAKALITITDDGDKAIRQLNACIDAYESVRKSLIPIGH